MLRRIARFSVLVFISLAHSASSQTSSVTLDFLTVGPVDRVVTSINEQQRVVLFGNRHPLAEMKNDIAAAPPDRRMERMILLLRTDEQQQRARDELTAAQQHPASPYYHQWLTPESYSHYFGVSESDQRRVQAWLMSHGLQLDEVTSGGSSILFSGTVAQVEEAFHTHIHAYLSGDELHYANASDPEIPASLSNVVEGVVSMHGFPLEPLHTGLSTAPPNLTGRNSRGMTPADFAAIYNLAPLYDSGVTGAGVTVAVAGRTNIGLEDIRSFRNSYKLPASEPEIIIDGPDPGRLGLEEEAEADLDLEWTGAVAQNALIKLVVSRSTSATDGIFLAARYIVEHNLAAVMSVNFGLCEAALGASANRFLQSLWQQAAVQGISVVVPSGNSGAACNDPSAAKARVRGVNGLSSTPYNTTVGGTEFDAANFDWPPSNDSAAHSSALIYAPEEVWNESGSTGLNASGGGVSLLYSKPEWQSGRGVPADGGRDVPDVALAAATRDGYQIHTNGTTLVTGGTSAASASFAGLMALLVQSTGARLGNPAPMLYALSRRERAFHDITKGNNGVPGVQGYSATAGYSLATGLGSVDAELLFDSWSKLADNSTDASTSSVGAASIQEQNTAAKAVTIETPPNPSTLKPVLYYSEVESVPATRGGGNYVCVNGENFGATQGASRLAVEGLEGAIYTSWSDLGKAYGPGHYAKACVYLRQQTPSSTAHIQLNTTRGSSNRLALATGQGSFGASGVGH